MREAAILLNLVAIVVVAAPARCNDWYVDAVNGSDAANGVSPATAWKSLTHARAAVPIGAAETIHLASGVYSASSGENFPIDVPPDFQIVGAGSTTVFRGVAGDVLFLFASDVNGPGWSLPPSTTLESVRLEYAAVGVKISSDALSVNPTLRDVEIDAMTTAGAHITSKAQPTGHIATCRLERVAIRNCAFAVFADTYAPVNRPIVAVDSVFELNARAWELDAYRTTYAVVQRCRFVDNSGWALGIGGGNLGTALLTVEDCLIASNTGAGVKLQYQSTIFGLGVYAQAELRRCTIANNAAGVNVVTYQCAAHIDDSIVAENVNDLKFLSSPGLSPMHVAHSLIEDGDFVGVNGNISGSPHFVNSLGGDWRLNRNSPCIDALPGPGASGTDFVGNPRTIDGDLDTSEAQDMGAIEFAPLQLAAAPSVGSQLRLECWGEAGGLSTVYFSRRPLASVPQSTPFGEFDLDPAQFGVLGSASAAGGAPALVMRNIPNAASLIGSTFTFQARTTSSIAPSGAAYTNPLSITILP